MEGNLGPLGLHNILQDLLTCFSGQLQNWNATLFGASRVFKHTSYKNMCSFLSTPLCPAFQRFGDKLCTYPAFAQNQPSPEEGGMTAWLYIPTKHMTKALCWPSLAHLQSQAPWGLILGWALIQSIANTCRAVDGIYGETSGPQRGFWFTIHSLGFSLRDGLCWLWERK